MKEEMNTLKSILSSKNKIKPKGTLSIFDYVKKIEASNDTAYCKSTS